MPDDKEAIIIICNPVSFGPPSIDGAAIAQCHECGTDVWIAPSSLDMIMTKIIEGVEAVVQCIPCGLANLEKAEAEGEEVTVAEVTELQKQEIAEQLKRDSAWKTI